MKNTSTFFSTVRYYNPLDPYFYSVDNRPLVDLNTNIQANATGVDSVRNLHEVFAYSAGAFLGAFGGSSGVFLSGLPTFSNLTVTVPEGILAVQRPASQTDATPVTKLAVSSEFIHTFTATPNAGEAQVFVVEAAFVDIQGGELVPLLDTANPQTIDNNLAGVVSVQVVAGASATIGTEVTPAITAGYFPLMRITIANGQTSVAASDVEYNNQFWLFPDSLKILNGGGTVPVRQSVIRGPVDGSGNPAALIAGTGLAVNLSASSEIDLSFAQGYSQGRSIDYTATLTRSITSAWSGLPASSTVYLYVERDLTTGWISYGVSTTAPTYAAVAPATPANGDSWFDTVNQVMYSWNSTTTAWDIVNRVYIGEAVTGASAITSVTTYAYRTTH